jgi:hypothetical protein
MKTILIILATAVMALAIQCKQVYTENPNFVCEDATLIQMFAPKDEHSAREIQMIRIQTWEGQKPTMTIYKENYPNEECKEKYYYVKEVMDEFRILQDKKVVCTSKKEYKPLSAWNKLKKEYTFKYLTPEELEEHEKAKERARTTSSSADDVDDYDLEEE